MRLKINDLPQDQGFPGHLDWYRAIGRHIPCLSPGLFEVIAGTFRHSVGAYAREGRSMFPPSVSNSLQQYDTFRELWRKRGSLARAAAKYAQGTGDHVFAVQEMLREHHEWPIPGLWDSLKTEQQDEVTIHQAIRDALAEQRVSFRRGRNSPFTTLARLQNEALAWMREPRLGLPSETCTAAVAEACYKNVVLTARMLVEQQAMREALHSFGIHRSADDIMVTTMRRSSDIVLADLDAKLETGMLLEDALAPDIFIESLNSGEQ